MARKLYFILLFSLVLINLRAQNIDLQSARLVANGFSRIYIPQSTGLKQATSDYTINNNGEPVYYIVNLAPKGFIIVPAYDAAPPVLGYTTENDYSPVGQPDNFKQWMEGYADVIHRLSESQTASTEGNALQWQALLNQNSNRNASTVTTVGPLIPCMWNQGAPYNYLCPVDGAGPGGHVWSGCVATAMSQIMYYWRYPNQGTGSHGYTYNPYGYLYANFGNTTYNWDEMANYATSQNFEMAQLQYHLGISVDMMYSPTGSGAYSTDAANALKNYFGYDQSLVLKYRDDYSYTAWKDILRSQIDLSQPMYYHGFGTGGHAFNVDGYQDTMYFHFNWGWGGSYNGYFHLFNLNPGGNSFTNGQGAIINFIPASNLNVVHCSQIDTLRNLTGSLEDGSGPVAPYFNNSSCGWLIMPDDTLESIKLTFDRFDIENGKDYLNIYDGTATDSPLIGSYTGNTIPPVVTATSGKMLIQFVTDGNGNTNGWEATYNAKPAPFCSSNTTTITAAAGNISDGSGSYNYRNKALCRYKLMPTNAKSISITFNYFDTYDEGDFLAIYNLDTQALLYTFHGNTNPGTVNFTTGKLYLVFITDNDNTATGWDLSYTSSTITGLAGSNLNIQASVYPNPVQNQLQVNITDPGKDCTIRLVSAEGKVVYKEDFVSTGNLVTNMDVSALRRGLYILQINSEKGYGYYKVVLE